MLAVPALVPSQSFNMTVETAPAAPGIQLNHLSFAYPSCPPSIVDASLELPRGSRCLLIGANGTGKTTLLQVRAAGAHRCWPHKPWIAGQPLGAMQSHAGRAETL